MHINETLMDRLAFGRRRVPVVLQTEIAECGLACLLMVARYYGHRMDLAWLRSQFPGSNKGMSLESLVDVAGRLGLASRAVRAELHQAGQLQLPCILHWKFTHFVVLVEVHTGGATIIDPMRGELRLSTRELSDAFTGVALELWPSAGFERREETRRIRLRDLWGHVHGLGRSLFQILLLALALELFAVMSPFFLQWVIDNVLLSADRVLLVTLAVSFGFLVVLKNAVSAARGWALLFMGTHLSVQWRTNVFTHLLRLPNQYFEKRHMGDIVSRFGSIESIQRTLTVSFVEAILDGLMTCLTVAMMLIYSPVLGLVSIVATAIYLVSRWVWFAGLRTATEASIVHAARQQSHFMETVRGIRTIKLFQREAVRRATWLTTLIDQVNADLRTQKMMIFYKVLNGLLFGLENVIVIGVGASLVLDGHFSAGMLVAFMGYKMMFAARVTALIDKMIECRMLQLQGERLADIVLTEPERAEPNSPVPVAALTTPRIEVSGLRFRYAAREPYVLDGVSFTIEPGESVAITGPSGCGKTTLLHILMGLLTPTEGAIRVDGRDMWEPGGNAFRSIAAGVLQDDSLFEGTIAENIAFFDPQAEPAWIEECGRLAAIHSEVMTMPMRYNTLVGYMGSVLSGGQKQRILLARALYRRPRVLLLDEATSHLDVRRESLVNAAIRSLKITRVIVAHRPQTIESADRLLVLSEGQIMSETASLSVARDIAIS